MPWVNLCLYNNLQAHHILVYQGRFIHNEGRLLSMQFYGIFTRLSFKLPVNKMYMRHSENDSIFYQQTSE